MLKDLEVHEVDCVYRNINCPFLDCNAEDVSFIGLGDHLEANHGDLKKIGKSRSNDFIPWWDEDAYVHGVVWIPQELGFRNRSFFTEVQRDDEIWNWKFWIYFLGTPEEAVHYSFRIKITGLNNKEFMFKGDVYSLDETKKALMDNKDMVHVYDSQVQVIDGKINFEITLYSDKEEIKNEDVESGISDVDDEDDE
jgi:hypothetical protein